MRARLLPAASLLLAGCAASAPTLPFPRADARGESPDPERAPAAARGFGPWHLSLEEIRRQTAILVLHPYDVIAPPGSGACFAGDGAYCLGSPDLIPLLEALVAGDGRLLDEHSLQDLHRRALPGHIPDLVRLLEPATGDLYRHLLWLIRRLADNTDQHREAVAGVLLYARAALLAEADGKPLPHLADIRFPGTGPATAEAFRLRYDALLGAREMEYREEFPQAWLDRWKRQEAGEPPPEETPALEVEAFTAAEAAARARELASRAPDTWREDGVALDHILPLIEVAAPEAFEELLRAWTGPDDVDLRTQREWERHGRRPDPAREAEALLDAIERGEDPAGPVAHVGLLGDRGRPALERVRRARHLGLYWPATAGLAISGDAAARSEFLAFLREDRIAVYDTDWDDVGFTLNGDPEALEHWRSRLDANCCLRFCADQALRRWYPTMPRGNTVADTDDAVRRARAWWNRWKDRFRWSRLADGWVPVAE